MTKFAFELAAIALDIGAIQLRPKDPFTWTSGYRMPIYNDNRLLLGKYAHRRLVAEGFAELVERYELAPEVIAGTETAGIAFGASVADLLQLPFVFVRKQAKAHGMGRRVEGVLRPDERVILIEDLISTGGSSLSALLGVRDCGGRIDTCLSIFSYGFREAQLEFEKAKAQFHPLFTVDTLIEVALKRRAISSDDAKMLEAWRSSPLTWGESHGFPRVIKEK